MTWEHDDVERYTAEAIEQKTVDTVVAAGGDGTVNEVHATWYARTTFTSASDLMGCISASCIDNQDKS